MYFYIYSMCCKLVVFYNIVLLHIHSQTETVNTHIYNNIRIITEFKG